MCKNLNLLEKLTEPTFITQALKESILDVILFPQLKPK